MRIGRKRLGREAGGGRGSRKQQRCNTNIAKILLHVLQNEERSCVSRFPVILEDIQINY